MNTTAITLVLISAIVHASWNIMAKQSNSETQFIGKMLPFVAAVGILPAGIAQFISGSLQGQAWLYVATSGICCGLYFFFLGKAYSNGDFTTVYPVARSLPVLLLAVGDIARGFPPSLIGWLGMALLVAGCLLAPLRTAHDFSLRQYWNRSTLWIVLTALGTVAYSSLDKRASELVPHGPLSASIYCYFYFLFAFLAYEAVFRLTGSKRTEANGINASWKPAVAGLFSYFGYMLVVWAYQLVQHTSYVVAFRQSSLLLGVLMAFALSKNERHPIRLVAVLISTAGLVLISLYG